MRQNNKMKGKILKIRELGDPIIRKVAKDVSLVQIKSKKFQKFTKDLIATCSAKDGVGIAAPQVDDKMWQSKRVFIVWSRPGKRYKKVPEMEPLVIINPKIISSSKKILKDWEGCLSIPGIRGLVPRYASVEVEFLDIFGEKVFAKFSGFLARIFQHEFDHLNGVVFIDRADLKNIMTESEFNKKMKIKK